MKLNMPWRRADYWSIVYQFYVLYAYNDRSIKTMFCITNVFHPIFIVEITYMRRDEDSAIHNATLTDCTRVTQDSQSPKARSESSLWQFFILSF